MGCIWLDVCWCYVTVWLWWCGIRMQAEALLFFHRRLVPITAATANEINISKYLVTGLSTTEVNAFTTM